MSRLAPLARHDRAILLALALGAALRLAFLLLPATSLETKAVASIPDATEYQTLAENLARHQAFSRSEQPPYRPDVLRTPGYPAFLAPFYIVFRSPLVPILAAQLVLSLLLVLAAYRLCLELTGERRVSVIAAFLVALSPNMAFISTKVVTETLFTLLLVVGFILFSRFRVFRRTRELVACGVCCGLLALIRPIAMFLPLLLAVILLFQSAPPPFHSLPLEGERRVRVVRRLLSAIVLVTCAAVVLLPWHVRNARLTGRWILSSAAEHNLVLYNAATVLAADQGISLVDARDLMQLEAEAETPVPLDTLDMAYYWQRLAPVAWRHILRKPWLAARVQLLGFLSTLASPISLRPLAVHSGANPDQEPNVAQRALAFLTRGRLKDTLQVVWQARLARLGWFGLVVFAASLVFQLSLLVLVLLFIVRRSSFIVLRSRLLWLLLPVLYFTLLTGALGEARMRVPVEPLLAILAAAAIRGRTGTTDKHGRTQMSGRDEPQRTQSPEPPSRDKPG